MFAAGGAPLSGDPLDGRRGATEHADAGVLGVGVCDVSDVQGVGAAALRACDCLHRPHPRESAVFDVGAVALPVRVSRRHDVRTVLLREDVLHAGGAELQVGERERDEV